ncbi:MAG: dTDP-4-dehydrorhamnose reductase [Gammaproteobacteria bacterium]
MKTILLTGKDGQLGWEIERTFNNLGKVITFDRSTLDLSDQNRLRKTIQNVKPDLIVNAAAYTAVDQAEKEPELAMAVNAVAPGIMAEEAKKIGATLIHYSTDYVFDGSKKTPYLEDDPTNPVNVYGKSKLLGELAIQEQKIPYLIFRTSWVYSHRGNNFLLTMLKLMKERESLNIVNDQFGAPTWSRTIAEISEQVLSKYSHNYSDLNKINGVYNLTCSGVTSWYGFAEMIKSLAKGNLEHSEKLILSGIPSEQYPTPAERPKYSQLSLEKISNTFGVKCPEWTKSLALCMNNIIASRSQT